MPFPKESGQSIVNNTLVAAVTAGANWHFRSSILVAAVFLAANFAGDSYAGGSGWYRSTRILSSPWRALARSYAV